MRICLAVLAALVFASPACAATWNVTSTGDQSDANVTDTGDSTTNVCDVQQCARGCSSPASGSR